MAYLASVLDLEIILVLYNCNISIVLVDNFLICGIVFMYQALYMMISYASILCGI